MNIEIYRTTTIKGVCITNTCPKHKPYLDDDDGEIPPEYYEKYLGDGVYGDYESY